MAKWIIDSEQLNELKNKVYEKTRLFKHLPDLDKRMALAEIIDKIQEIIESAEEVNGV